MNGSQLKRYSIGVVAENKPLDVTTLNVTPVEVLSGLDGEIQLSPEDKVSEGVDADGKSYQVRATTDITLTADWLPLGSNRVSAPDMRRGELVEIYRVADNDTFYWRDMGLRPDLRRLETVIWAFNGSPDNGPGNGIDPARCYFFEVSTHTGQVNLSTSQANGEACTYALQFNTRDGQVTLEDNVGNSFHLDSPQAFFEMINASNTRLQLDKKNLYGKADTEIAFEAGQSMVLKAGQSISLEAGNKIDLKTKTYTIQATTTNIQSNVVMAGSFYSEGAGNPDAASMTLDGNMRFNGNINVTGGIQCDYITANTYQNLPG